MIAQAYQRHRALFDGVLAVLTGLFMGYSALVVGVEGFNSRLAQLLAGGIGVVVLMIVVRDIKRILLMAIFIDMSIAFDFHITCNTDYFMAACGINISLTLLALVALYVLWFIGRKKGAVSGLNRARRLNAIGRFGLAFVFSGVLSLIASRVVSFGVYQIWQDMLLFALFFYLSNNLRSRDDVLFVIVAILVGLMIQIAVMELGSFGVLHQDSKLRFAGRVIGTLKSPNIAGGLLAQITILMIASLALPLPRFVKPLVIGAILFGLGNLVGTESRGAWVAVTVAVAILGVTSLWKGWLPFKYLLVALFGILVLASVFSAPIIDRFTRDDNGAADARAPLAEIAFNMIRANPVLGVGINNFGVVLYDYVEPDQFGAWLNLVHNLWLLIWAETGTVGFAFYVAFYATTLWQGWRLVRKGHPFYGPLALGIVAAMVGAGCHMLMEIYRGRVLQQISWTYAALIVALSRLQATDESDAVRAVASAARANVAPIMSAWRKL
jgi:hypothetical protein